MAKKKPTETPESAATPEAPPAAEEKEKKKEKKAKPEAPKGDAAPKPPAAPVAEGAPRPAAPAPEGGAKKKKKPGEAPRRGKKLRNQLKNVRQKIAKTGPSPLKPAVILLKSVKRAKFDETVEVHMALGIDPNQS